MKVNTYDELHLGPVDKNPEIQKVFGYQPPYNNTPIPEITTGDVIQHFENFHLKYHGNRGEIFNAFIDELVRFYKLQRREELGIFVKSFPFLVQVSTHVCMMKRSIIAI
jgi:hypothetical protein